MYGSTTAGLRVSRGSVQYALSSWPDKASRWNGGVSVVQYGPKRPFASLPRSPRCAASSPSKPFGT